MTKAATSAIGDGAHGADAASFRLLEGAISKPPENKVGRWALAADTEMSTTTQQRRSAEGAPSFDGNVVGRAYRATPW